MKLCLLRQPTLQTPLYFVRVLGLAFPDTRFTKLDYIRPWRAFLSPLGVQFTGMFGSRRSPHVYSFQQRSSTAPSLVRTARAQPTRARARAPGAWFGNSRFSPQTKAPPAQGFGPGSRTLLTRSRTAMLW